MPVPSTIARGGILATLTLVSACGGSGLGRDGVTLIGGIPPATDLPGATGLPPDAVYTVVRAAEGWRVVFRASADDPAAVAARLCRLEGRAPAAIRNEPIASSEQLPDARKITITCRG